MDSLDFFLDGAHYVLDNPIDGQVVEYGDDAMMVFADTDGDGTVDRVSAVDYEGGYKVWDVVPQDAEKTGAVQEWKPGMWQAEYWG